MNKKNILILRNGSLGDTVVALPSFRAIASAFTDARRIVLTAQPADSRAVQLESVLTGTGYVHEFRGYNGRATLTRKYQEVRSHIRELRPYLTIYLFEPRHGWAMWRDALFLAICGAGWMRGLPLTQDLRRNRWIKGLAQYEHEADRLLRVLSTFLDRQESATAGDWLNLSIDEKNSADFFLADWSGKTRFLAASLGSRVLLKDWGEAKWFSLLSQISDRFPSLGLIILGTEDDRRQADRVSLSWSGPFLNLCGRTSPRVSAAVMQQAVLFLGNDGGSMHLAAAVGTPCVAVFSARSPKGVWYPYGPMHRVHYRNLPCSGCLLDVCNERHRECITSITVPEVLGSVREILDNPVDSD